MLTSIHVDFVQHMGKCQALCVFYIRKILHFLSGMRIFRFFKGFRVFCMWRNTWNPLKITSFFIRSYGPFWYFRWFLIWSLSCPVYGIWCIWLGGRGRGIMMSFYQITGPLWEESGSHWWIPLTKSQWCRTIIFFCGDLLWFLSICNNVCPKCFTSVGNVADSIWFNMKM